jgi:hypothetical protein
VAIAVQPDLPRDAKPDELLRFEISVDDGRLAWSEEMSIGAARADLASFDVVLFQISTEVLCPGSYDLTLVLVERPERAPLLHVPFEIQAAE